MKMDSDEEEGGIVEGEGKYVMAVSNDDIVNGEQKLPNKIKMINGEMFVLRKYPAVVSFPSYSEDQKLASSVILFRHHVADDDFIISSVVDFEVLFNEKDVAYEVNADGKALTKIDTIKMRLPLAVANVDYDIDTHDRFVNISFE